MHAMANDQAVYRLPWRLTTVFGLSVLLHVLILAMPAWPDRPHQFDRLHGLAPSALVVTIRTDLAPALPRLQPRVGAESQPLPPDASAPLARPNTRTHGKAATQSWIASQSVEPAVPVDGLAAHEAPSAAAAFGMTAAGHSGVASAVPSAFLPINRDAAATAELVATSAAQRQVYREQTRAEMAHFLIVLQRLPVGPDMRCTFQARPACDGAPEPFVLLLLSSRAGRWDPATALVRRAGRWFLERIDASES